MAIIKWIMVMMIFSLLTVSCEENSTDRGDDIIIELTEIIKSGWDNYSEPFPDLQGGISVIVRSGENGYFVTHKMGEEMTETTRFRAASITKIFTAASIMLLQEKGLLNIDSTIVSNFPGSSEPYLPDTPAYNLPYKEDITIRLLLQHRAGIFDLNNSSIPEELEVPYAGMNYIYYVLSQDEQHTFTVDEMAGVVSLNQLCYCEPGSEYHYSDTGFSLLSKIIERVSGESYPDFVAENILQPNGLADSYLPFLGTDQVMEEPFVSGYEYYEGISYPVEYDNISFQVGNGNLVSSLNDLSNFAKLLFTGQTELSMSSVNMMSATIPTGTGSEYGLGCSMVYDLGYGHAGAVRGYISAMYYDLENDISIAIISNVANWDDIVNEVLFHRNLAISIKDKLLAD